MIVMDGYNIVQYPKENRIVITLPQTLNTMNNTVTPVSERRQRITAEEETILLTIVKDMYERRSE